MKQAQPGNNKSSLTSSYRQLTVVNVETGKGKMI